MKKIISLIAAFAMSASLFTVAQAADTVTITMDVTGGTKAGETVTVKVNYSGLNATPYDDDEGAGAQLDGYGVKIIIPGGIAASDAQFLRKGATNASNIAGTASQKFDTTAGTFITGVMGGDDAANASGLLATFTMTLAADIPAEGLAFTFDKTYPATFSVNNMVDWTYDSGVTYKTSTGTMLLVDPAVYGKAEEEPQPAGDYEVTEKGYGKDADDATVATYYTIMFNNGLTADNATIAISKDATREWKITDLPTIEASAKLTWVFNGLTDGLYDVVKVLDGETELSAE